MSEWDAAREDGERISREEAYKAMAAEVAALHAENARLKERLSALAWIPVRERLPKPHSWVIASELIESHGFPDCRTSRPAWVNGDGEFWTANLSGHMTTTTHWMPLPGFPE